MTAQAPLFALLSRRTSKNVMAHPRAIVFVADDDVSVHESLRGLIRSIGSEVQTFTSAKEFLAARQVDGLLDKHTLELCQIRLAGQHA